MIGSAGIGHDDHAKHAVVFIQEVGLLGDLLFQELGVSTVFNHDLLHHLTYDDFKVLVVDFHPLQAVDVLDFIHDVLLHRRWAHDIQDVVGRDGTIRHWHSCLDEIVVLHQDVLGQWNHVLEFLTCTCFHNQLCHTWKTTCDVTRLSCHTWNLAKDHSFGHLVAFLDGQVGSNRHRIGAKHFFLLAHDQHRRVFLLVAGFCDHNFTEARLLVQLFAEGEPFFNALKGNGSLLFRDDHVVVGIPLTDRSVLFDLVSVLDKEDGAIRQHRRGQRHIGFSVHHLEFGRTRNDHHFLFAIGVGAVHRPQFIDLHHTRMFGADLVLVRNLRGCTTHVESTQGQLCSRLADGLRCNDTHCLARLDWAVGRKVFAVALRTDTLTRLASQHRTHLDFLNTRLFNGLRGLGSDLFSFCNQNLFRGGVVDVLACRTAFDSVPNAFHDFVVLTQW